jgi:dTMP kinase
VRDILLDPQFSEMRPLTGALLFSASRAQLVSEVIRPHLEGDGVVLCDRYADSTYAYQGYGRGVNLDLLRRITALATGGLVPDLTLYLDLPVEEGLERRLHPPASPSLSREGYRGSRESLPLWQERDRLDMEHLEFHRRVRQGYLELAGDDPQRWVVIPAGRSAEDVQVDIQASVEERLSG